MPLDVAECHVFPLGINVNPDYFLDLVAFGGLRCIFLQCDIHLLECIEGIYLFYFFKDFVYLFMRHREAETQAEGEAGSLWGGPSRTQSQALGSQDHDLSQKQMVTHEPLRCSYRGTLKEM